MIVLLQITAISDHELYGDHIMPYLGNTAGDRFVAAKAATQFSGDGSTTAFTLEHSVGSDEDILVSVDGVIQEPSVAYTVSSGTTLTFAAAPSNNSGNNIFVYYLFRTVGTVNHPAEMLYKLQVVHLQVM